MHLLWCVRANDALVGNVRGGSYVEVFQRQAQAYLYRSVGTTQSGDPDDGDSVRLYRPIAEVIEEEPPPTIRYETHGLALE